MAQTRVVQLHSTHKNRAFITHPFFAHYKRETKLTTVSVCFSVVYLLVAIGLDDGVVCCSGNLSR